MNRKQRRDQQFNRIKKANYFDRNVKMLYNRDLQLSMKGSYAEANLKMVDDQESKKRIAYESFLANQETLRRINEEAKTKEEVKDEIQISE